MNKKDYSYFLGMLSCVLALFWVYLIYVGWNIQKENNINKLISKQKIVLAIPEDKKAYTELASNIEQQIENINKTVDIHNIALLIDQFEFGSEFINNIKMLPKEITIGVSPYSEPLLDIVSAIKDNGNDVFIEVPFIVPHNDTTVREYDIASSFNAEEIHYRLQKILDKIDYTIGVYNLGHDKFLHSVDAISSIVDHLHKSNLFFLYGINDKTIVLESDNENVFAVEACDIVIDKGQTQDKTLQALRDLEEIAKKKGKAIGVVRFDSANIDSIQKWLTTLDSKNIKIVPIKALPKKITVSG